MPLSKLVGLSALQVPIIVSETGVSDQRHVLRARCISSYYNEVRNGWMDNSLKACIALYVLRCSQLWV